MSIHIFIHHDLLVTFIEQTNLVQLNFASQASTILFQLFFCKSEELESSMFFKGKEQTCAIGVGRQVLKCLLLKSFGTNQHDKLCDEPET